MKDKNVAGILALFFGAFGVHRFYLGQVGLGITYAILAMTGISFFLGMIDALTFFSMDKEKFDLKYNPQFFEVVRRENADFERRDSRREQRREYREDKRERRQEQRHQQFEPKAPRQGQPQASERNLRANEFKKSGIDKYKEYDFEGAIEDFKKSLEINPNDVAVHFNLACAYSLNENADLSFSHLDKAVGLGFSDFQRIKTHDALAYLRIQDKFEEFEKNGFRIIAKLEAPKEDNLLDQMPPADLLQQLQKLQELREKGLLTEEEFSSQRKKLMG